MYGAYTFGYSNDCGKDLKTWAFGNIFHICQQIYFPTDSKFVHPIGGELKGVGCALGFFADESVCKLCHCFPPGTKLDEKSLTPICDNLTGKCLCKKSVAGEHCNRCRDGYFNFTRDKVSYIFVFQDCHFQKN